MNEKFRSDLWRQYGNLLEVAEQTVEAFGEEQAWLFVDLANDWIDIHFDALLGRYPHDTLLTSLVYHDFTGLFQQIRWSQLLFLGGNYPLQLRNLRFIWELAFRAFYADARASRHPGDADAPETSAEEKAVWLEAHERQLNWNTVIATGLHAILAPSDREAIEGHYHGLWDRLNRCVHPSRSLRDRMIEESALLIKDSFDERWAVESLDVSGQVFDLVWLSILSRFPEGARNLDPSCTFRSCPRTREMLQRLRAGDSPLS